MAESRRAIGQFSVQADDRVAVQLAGEMEQQLAGRFKEFGTPEAQMQVRIRAVFTASGPPTSIVLVAAIVWPGSLVRAVVADFELHEDPRKAIASFVGECVSAVDDMTAAARAARGPGSHDADLNYDEDHYEGDHYEEDFNFYEEDSDGHDGLDSSTSMGPGNEPELDDSDLEENPVAGATPQGAGGAGPAPSLLFTVAEAEIAEIRAIPVPDRLFELRDLVANSYSLNLAEKRDITGVMPDYDDDRIIKLYRILIEEQEKFAALNEKHLARMKELSRKDIAASAANTPVRRAPLPIEAGAGRGGAALEQTFGELQDVKRIFDEARRAVRR